MSDFDLIIRGGTVVDGSGGEPYAADVAVKDGKIAKVGQVSGSADQEIDAKGKLVTPGFIDVHTHYDGQAVWSERMIPSSIHGVTTVVMGNCGVGFAPCRKDDHDLLVSVMEGVEDVPEVVMTAGLPWDWETFPEYLDAVDRRPRDIDVAAYLPHSPLRVYVMGERGARREAPTDADIEEMKRLAREAMDAGALGFATSRLSAHATGQGDKIPSFDVGDRELFAMGEVMKERGEGVLQIVSDIGSNYDSEIQTLADLAVESGQQVTFTLAQMNQDPEAWRRSVDKMRKAQEKGAKIKGQVYPRPIGMVMSLDATVNPFCCSPTYAHELVQLPMAERVKRLADPAMREKLLAEEIEEAKTPIYRMARDWSKVFLLDNVADYEPDQSMSIEAMAAREGRDPLDLFYDLMLRKGGYQMFYCALANYAEGSLDSIREMIMDPSTIVALGDGGAHYGVVCDASYPTFVLTHWARDREGERIPLPQAVKALTRDPAEVIGLKDRGLVKEGYKADLNVVDFDRLQLNMPSMIGDLPGDGRRLMQDADGYVATIVSGEVILRDGKSTPARPGRLVRGAKQDPARHLETA